MNLQWNDFVEFAPWVAIAAVIAHGFIRQFWIACGVAAIGCSLLNMAVEIAKHDFRIRPSDVAFWLPMEFACGAAMAAPVAFLVGLPFFLYRRWRKPR